MEISKQRTKEDVVDAFNLMWGTFPSPVMLITYKHEIVAVNKMCASLGVSTGIKCSSLNGGNHKLCRAAEARKTGEAVRKVCYLSDTEIVSDGYWIPIEGEYMVHFGNDITEYADVEKCRQLG